MTHICINKLIIIVSDNGLSPGLCQAIIWTNDIINWTLRSKPQGNYDGNSYIFILKRAFENAGWKMMAILSCLQCVNCMCSTSRSIFYFEVRSQNNDMCCMSFYILMNYHKTSSINRTKSQSLNVSCILVQLSSRNPLKPDVKLRMKMQFEQCRQAMLQLHLSYQQFYCLLRCDLY